PYTLDVGRFTRTFRLHVEQELRTDEELARAIAEYIKMFDEILKIYFANIENRRLAAELSVARYHEYLKKGIIII
ncbi:MAG: hypothetical protein K2N29_06960, partial [Ruminiclostridium sp.]|nr:hypothetical protein [Ruminiclostridium sp.]